MRSHLDLIVWEWAVRCFGIEHCSNPSIRALRLAEEAVELAQSVAVPEETLHHLIDTVYARPPGNTLQEIGGIMVGVKIMCMTLGTDSDGEFARELRRVLEKPVEHFAKRNQEKLDLGLDA